MTHAIVIEENRPAAEVEPVSTPAPGAHAPAQPMTVEPHMFHGRRLDEVLARLAEPFAAEVISWKPQVVTWKDPENPKAKGAAYADPRAYSDRLNELFGPEGWTREYTVTVATGLDRVVTKKGGETQTTPNQGKVFVVAKVTVHSLGTHVGTGESWIDDDNAMTSAEAQAFKRACVCFGLGRYLYDLPETAWLPIDKFSRQFKTDPTLPEWALPAKKCATCQHAIQERTINRVHYTAEALARRGRELYGVDLCAACQIERARVNTQAPGPPPRPAAPLVTTGKPAPDNGHYPD